ncbi:hypothetical protein RRG08_035955 [Elysia crispata]|uniref:ILCR1 Ig-like domain-containing protein n=1 Tax=Elysia crispata TaxID=231223 RepID=A0AAE1ARC8_9GAST|nr:hypothetical protein RRG08_035955 [Elysia crispata]
MSEELTETRAARCTSIYCHLYEMAFTQYVERKKMAVLIFGHVVLLSSLCVDFALSGNKSCTLEVFEQTSANLIKDLCLEEYEKEECRPFSKTFNRSNLPESFSIPDDEDSVQKPKSLKIVMTINHFIRGRTRYHIPGASVTWSSPDDRLSRENTKGYLLIWEHRTNLMCSLFKLDSNKTDLLSEELRFHYNIQHLEPRKSFLVKVYSIPPPKSLEESQKTSTFASFQISAGPTIRPYTDPGEWIPPVTARPIEGGAIEVKIGHSPSRFNLTQFKVMLVKRSFDENNTFKTTFYKEPPGSQKPSGLVSFTNLDNDEYKISIHVIDPFLKQVGKCLCWIKETNVRHCQNSCGSVQTDWIKVSVHVREETDQPKSERSTASSPSEFNTCIIIIALLTLQNVMF